MKKALVMMFALLFSVSVAYGQATSGALVGVVRDATGASVPLADITAKNVATGVVYAGVSGAAGEYRISNLPNGTYDLTTSVSGFAPSTVKGIAVDANNVQTQDIALSIKGQATTVEVSSQAAVAIDTTTAQISSTFIQKETQDLPTASVGLGVLNLSLLSPGVTSTGGLGAGTGPSVSGQRPRNNNFTIDGVDNNSKSVTGPLLFVPNDAVGEFTALQNVYGAQYGHSTGGQFNSLIISGTNSVHGRLYEYMQNRNLNAVSNLSRISNLAQGLAPNFKPRFDFNRYGGQLGGPAIKNRLFLFSNYERHETGQSASSTYCSPTAAGFATLNSLAFLSTTNYSVYKQYSQPAPNVGGGACPTSVSVNSTTTTGVQVASGAFGFQVPLFQNTDYSTSSADYTISQHDSIRFRYVYNRTDGTDTSASFQAFFGPSPSRLHLANISEVHTFSPNLSNEFRLGFNRLFSQTPVPPISFPGLSVFPNLVFDDLNFVNLGPDPNAPQATIQNLYQGVDTLTWVKGRHTINVGIEGRKYISPEVFVQRLRGDYEYSTLNLYLNDISPDSVGQRNATPPGVSPTFYGDQSSIYLYGNDDYRVSPKLTLNLGLRYEFTSVPASEKLQSLNSAASVPGLISFNQPNAQKKNFAPRIGIAYAPNENTSIRAGFGINYDVLYDNIGTTTAPPQFQVTENVTLTAGTPGFLAGGGLPQNATFANLAAQRVATTAFVPDQKLPYSEQWVLGVQHVFHNDYTAEVRYVGTRGVHLDLQDQLNVQSPVNPGNQLPTGFNGATVVPNGANTLNTLKANNSAGGPYYRIAAYTTAGLTSTITADMPFGGSNYNGLQTQLQRRLQKGLLLNAAYTYSRAMDDSTADFNSTALNPRRVQDFQNIKGDYSVSDLDRRHRLTLVAVYDEPFFKSSGFLLRNTLGNWEVAPSYTFQSPQLTTVQSTNDSNLNNDAASDRVFINANGVKGTGSGVVAVVNPAISCGTTALTPGLLAGTNTVVGGCAANTVGYSEGKFSTAVVATAVFTASNAYYVQAGNGTDPSAPRNNLPTGRTNNLDLSAIKRISYRERYKFEFEAQAINVLNHSQYLPGSPSQANSISSTGSRSFDTVTAPSFNSKQINFSNNPRFVQLSVKLAF
jgi:hypothetical protein